MSKRIESTVEKLPQDLAKAGVMGNQHVFVTILDDEEVIKLAELRAAIQIGIDEADQGMLVDGETVFKELYAKYPATQS